MKKNNSKSASFALQALRADVALIVGAARRRGARLPWLVACGDTSLWVLVLLRLRVVLCSVFGTSFGVGVLLRLLFHIDIWTDDLGPGLRLPHAFNIVIGEGVSIGPNCTLMHNVTIQRGEGTQIGAGVVLGVGSIVLAGAKIGEASMIGAASVVRGLIPAGSVAVGAPARVVRKVSVSETSPVDFLALSPLEVL